MDERKNEEYVLEEMMLRERYINDIVKLINEMEDISHIEAVYWFVKRLRD